MFFGKKGQGTIEYLVIIAVVVVVSLVVVGLVISLTGSPSQQISSSGNELGLASSSIGITESLVSNDDGNFVVRLLNNSGENITVSNVKIGDSNVDYSKDLAQGGESFFKVSIDANCVEGKVVSEEVSVTYVTRYGLTKVENYPVKVMFNCTPFVIDQARLADQCPTCEECEECADPGIGFIDFDAPVYTSTDGGLTVTDSANGLVWQASSYNSGGTLTWDNAMKYCNDNEGSLPGTGWRVPNLAEIVLLFNHATEDMYSDYFSNNVSFWSSTTIVSIPNYAYYLGGLASFGFGGKSFGEYNGVRCVRSA